MLCPRCGVPIQKTMGCNKMTCVTCEAKFCYLCGEILPSENPYTHYSLDSPMASKSCRGLLFHGVDADGQIRDAEGRRVEGRNPFWWRRHDWARRPDEGEEGGGDGAGRRVEGRNRCWGGGHEWGRRPEGGEEGGGEGAGEEEEEEGRVFGM